MCVWCVRRFRELECGALKEGSDVRLLDVVWCGVSERWSAVRCGERGERCACGVCDVSDRCGAVRCDTKGCGADPCVVAWHGVEPVWRC